MSQNGNIAEKTTEAKGPRRTKEAPICGIIMPISETASHSEEHWRDVQTLLHRAVAAAGFSPRNVWESTSTDRISERIIGNIFRVPIAVADISDLNPNVMLELGLRLASKKPTIVVANSGGAIPFDIRDFQAIFYPGDMNILAMEDFFSRLTKALNEKHDASQKDTYTPFLGNVVVDVASPETREVGVNEILLSRLDDITDRLRSVEVHVRRPQAAIVPTQPRRSYRGTYEFKIDDDKFSDFFFEVHALFEVDRVERKSIEEGVATGEIIYSSTSNQTMLYNKLEEIISKYGGELDVPF